MRACFMYTLSLLFASRLGSVAQTQILKEAGDALCGMRLEKQIAFHHLFAHAWCDIFYIVALGGTLNFVYSQNKV